MRQDWLAKITDLTGPKPLALPPFREINHRIPFIDENIRLKYRTPRCPDALREQLNDKVKTYTTAGWWQERNVSQASPLLCIQKKSGKLRTVVDCRERNLNTVKDVTPFPDQDMIRNDVARAKIRTKLDMSDAYEQIRVEPEDVEKTGFSTVLGTFVSNVMQMGDCNAPATFQRLMTMIFREHIGRFTYVYLDDIFIFSDTVEEHEKHLEIVFNILRKSHLFLGADKCEIYSQRMDCLGHIVDDTGIHADADKMRSIRDWPQPQNYNDIQRFLGLVNYIAQFMPNVSNYTSPLSAISKLKTFQWTALHERCFEMIKQLACRSPVLTPIDYPRAIREGEEIFLICDASTVGVGAYYGQGKNWKTCRPAGFLSKKFSSAQISYRTYEQETIAILEGLMKWEDKLLGRPIKIVTDHRALEHFESQARLSNRQIRWAEYLSRFKFKIEYVEGEQNIVADALSRYYASLPPGTKIPEDVWVDADKRLDPEGEDLPIDRQLKGKAVRPIRQKRPPPKRIGKPLCKTRKPIIEESNTEIIPDDEDTGNVFTSGTHQSSRLPQKLGKSFLDVIRRGYTSDVILKKVVNAIHEHPYFTLEDGFLYVKNSMNERVVCVPRSLFEGRRITEIAIDQAHRIIGHKASRKTLEYLKRYYWWPTMSKDVDAFCKSCGECQTIKSSTSKPYGLLHTLPIPNRPWESVGMDFVGPFPKSKGFDYMLVVICRLTSMVHLIPMNTTATANDVAWLYLREVVRLHGIPKSIVSDRDARFISKFWQELHRLAGTRLMMSTAYHPQTDGATERAIRHVEHVLRTLVDSDQLNWADCCPMAEFAINSSVSATTHFAPFELNYGWLPSMLNERTDASYTGVQNFVDMAIQRLSEAHDAIIASRVDQTYQANKHRRPEPTMKVGDLAYLSTANLNLPKNRAAKLNPRFIGPYPIIEENSSKSTYTLALPPELVRRNIFPKFHVSRLRKHIPNDDDRFPKREVQTYFDFGDDPETEWVVKEIIDHRWTRGKLELRVSWSLGDVTWEPISHCQDLAALDDYLALRGFRSPDELPRSDEPRRR